MAFTLLWLQSGGCGGCTISLLGAESPDLKRTLAAGNIEILWHPTLSEESGSEALEIIEKILSGELKLDALCIEGALLRGPRGSGRFHILSGTERPMIEWVQRLAAVARYTLAIGTCSAYGGITAGNANPTEACGLQYDGWEPGGLLGEEYRSQGGLPVINVAGCPTHPNWITETLLLLAAASLHESDLDPLGRPRFYADQLVHHGCARNEYYEYKASAEHLSQLGCLMEHLGCIGTQAHGDCNQRHWNGEGSCTRGGAPCINCTAPEFEDPGHPFAQTPKIAGIPIGLPTDMPRAWFVALASLSKAATPPRLRKNATTDHVEVPPKIRKTNRH